MLSNQIAADVRNKHINKKKEIHRRYLGSLAVLEALGAQVQDCLRQYSSHRFLPSDLKHCDHRQCFLCTAVHFL